MDMLDSITLAVVTAHLILYVARWALSTPRAKLAIKKWRRRGR